MSVNKLALSLALLLAPSFALAQAPNLQPGPAAKQEIEGKLVKALNRLVKPERDLARTQGQSTSPFLYKRSGLNVSYTFDPLIQDVTRYRMTLTAVALNKLGGKGSSDASATQGAFNFQPKPRKPVPWRVTLGNVYALRSCGTPVPK